MFSRVSLPWLAVACALSCAAEARAATMAVLPLRAEGLQLNEAQRLNLLVRMRAASRGGHVVQSEELTTNLVEASQSLGVDCDVNAVQCGAELGKIADVELVLLGRATSVDDAGARFIGVTLRVVDVKGAREQRRVTALVPANAEEQTAAMDALTSLLFDANAPLAALSVRTDPAGADVYVDGELSRAPERIDALAPGAHVVRVAQKGFLAQTQRAELHAGEAQLDAVLAVDPDAVHETVTVKETTTTSPLAIAVPFIVAGAGTALAVGGGVAIVVGVGPYNRIQSNEERIRALDASSARDPAYPSKVRDLHDDSDRALEEWNSWGQAAVVTGGVLLGVGALASLGGGVAGAIFLLE
jgi:hypothetical protein